MEAIESTIQQFKKGRISLVGVLQDISRVFGYLPEDTTDFIFAVVCEELGIVGAAVVISQTLLLSDQGKELRVGDSPVVRGRRLPGRVCRAGRPSLPRRRIGPRAQALLASVPAPLNSRYELLPDCRVRGISRMIPRVCLTRAR